MIYAKSFPTTSISDYRASDTMFNDINGVKEFKELQELYLGRVTAVDLLSADHDNKDEALKKIKNFMSRFISRFGDAEIQKDADSNFDEMIKNMSDAELELFKIVALEKLSNIELYTAKLSSDLDKKFTRFDWND